MLSYQMVVFGKIILLLKFPIFWISYIKDYTPRLTKILQHVPLKIHQARVDMDFDEFFNLYIS
jgi:hypothetical protein